jgi:hypothetical protein
MNFSLLESSNQAAFNGNNFIFLTLINNKLY